MSDRQCSSCGGFCGRGGCKRENVKPEQEPVARVKTVGGYPDASEHTVEWLVKFKDVMSGQLLYAAPPARKPLTDYQIREIDELVWKELSCEEKTLGQFALKMARAIERAHGITE